MKNPTPVQRNCIPRILSGQDVLGLAQTGSGKTAAFALPILLLLAEDPYGVSCLVVTPTRELAFQLAEQFRALGSCLNLRCAVVVGGIDMINRTKSLMQRPHVVIATPGRIKVLIEQNPDLPWHCGAMAPRHHGTKAPWHHGTVAPSHHDTMAPRQHGTKAAWRHGTKALTHRGKIKRA
ncbi:DEAD-box ATP-dependent RNA helicase 36 [Capsicum baccatum]|uniref:DEAD-box ATP-dependent RNA helicase 36 n=1 Tax=Capsicum baccatum TaxID=33114 RepID=A0A2G2VR64_CAPBA|nr:DEAD-box ATP-dependent RNA helicase 36 [Capsicum baccatum]